MSEVDSVKLTAYFHPSSKKEELEKHTCIAEEAAPLGEAKNHTGMAAPWPDLPSRSPLAGAPRALPPIPQTLSEDTQEKLARPTRETEAGRKKKRKKRKRTHSKTGGAEEKDEASAKPSEWSRQTQSDVSVPRRISSLEEQLNHNDLAANLAAPEVQESKTDVFSTHAAGDTPQTSQEGPISLPGGGMFYPVGVSAPPSRFLPMQPVSSSAAGMTPQSAAFSGFESEQDIPSIASDMDNEMPPDPPCASCCLKEEEKVLWYLNKPRRHAFQRPLHAFQIAAALVKIIGHGCFWASVVPGLVLLYKDGYNTALIEVLVFSVILVIFSITLYGSWLFISFMDCTDYGIVNGELCIYCRRRSAVTSKHCKACNKCVSGFDHHCKWLNMCIGARNYKLFICYMVSAVCAMSTALIAAVIFLAQWWNELSAHSVYFRIMPFFLIFLMLVGVIPIAKLLLFHIELSINHITTYQYINMKRQRNKAQQKSS